jgi:ATP synthase F1 delta subunit
MTSMTVLAAEPGGHPLIPAVYDIVWSAVCFALIFLVFWKVLLPKFRTVLDERSSAIQGGIEKAEKVQAEADAALAEYQKQLADGRAEAARLRAEAQEEGAQIIASMKQQATEESERILAQAKRTLVRDLLGSAAAEETVLLAQQAAAHPRGIRVSEALDNYGEVLAARQRRSVAEVVVARPLTPQQQERLTQSLSRSYGRELVLHVQVDPDVVGGVRVQVGDEVMSGTIADRLSDVRRRLTS